MDDKKEENDKKEKTGFWRSWMTIAVLAALTVMVFIFNSQSPSIRLDQNVNVSISNGTNIAGNGTGNDTDITNSNIAIINNDTFFKNSVEVNLAVILENLNCISEAGRNRNFNATERCGKFLSESSNIYLRNARGYNVSPSLQPALEQYKSALEFYNIGGTRLEIGARNRNLSQMGDAIEYIQNGTTNVNRVTEVLYGNGTYNTISNTSSSNANTSSNATFIHPKITNVGEK